MLITEGLAELKTLVKRIQKKQEYITTYLYRHDGMKDPLEKDGGAEKVLSQELQALGDLNKRIVTIRTAIQRTNLTTPLTIEGVTMSIAEWLTWRKEVSDGEVRFNQLMRSKINQVRATALSRGTAVVPAGTPTNNPTDVVVNVNEGDLNSQAEKYEVILGILDGQLSLKNATVTIEGI